MTEYQILENDIISIFKNENPKSDENNPIRTEQLLEIFNIYWKTYQDKWTDKYWEIYESLHQRNTESERSDVSNIIEVKNEEDKIIFSNDSILADNLNKNNNNNILNKFDENGINFNSKDNMKFNSTNLQTKTMINLQDIDDELDKINEISVIKEKKQQEKRRNCFDCNVF